MPDRRPGDVRLDPTDAAELLELLSLIGDWLDGPDSAQHASSLRQFIGNDGYRLTDLQADLARLASLLGDNGERILDE